MDGPLPVLEEPFEEPEVKKQRTEGYGEQFTLH